MNNKEIEIDLGRVFKALLHKLWLILLVAVISFGLSLVLIKSVKTVPLYRAEATVYSVANGSYKLSVEGTNAMKDYSEIITTLKVSERAALLLGDDSINGYYIMNCITPYYTEDSSILTIRCLDRNPEMAIKIANAVANAFVIEMRTITGTEDVQMLDEAYTYYLYQTGATSATVKRLIFIAVIVFILCAYIALNEIFTTKLKTIRECTLGGELDVIGVIPVYKN
ncbi:MAG: Wzz/FepE/Etk N-terminal domain-containing protein [Clostridiales bacterium]|nr:Wzz/FepE/Etk N-terminal domain-containing protein [Clostridiales bacterium]